MLIDILQKFSELEKFNIFFLINFRLNITVTFKGKYLSLYRNGTMTHDVAVNQHQAVSARRILIKLGFNEKREKYKP